MSSSHLVIARLEPYRPLLTRQAAANNPAAYSPYIPISTIRSEYPNAKVLIGTPFHSHLASSYLPRQPLVDGVTTSDSTQSPSQTRASNNSPTMSTPCSRTPALTALTLTGNTLAATVQTTNKSPTKRRRTKLKPSPNSL